MMLRNAVAVLALSSTALLAQTPDRSLTFDVASIKPSAAQGYGKIMMGMRGGPGSSDPGHVTFSNMPLSRLIMTDWGVKSFQVSGPSWMDSQRFDISAKVPDGATKQQFQVMLQNLLAERFKLRVHNEKKEVPMYALVVGKGGPKLKESSKDDAPADPTPARPAGSDGAPRMASGRRGEILTLGPSGFRMQGAHETTAILADVLSNQLGRPVIDATGLTAEYDYTLDFSPEGLAGMRGMPMTGPPPGAEARDAEPGPSLFTAVQEQLGLKLESRKGPVDLIVVDSVEKTPTEN